MFTLVPPARSVHDGKVVYPVVNEELDCIYCMWKDFKSVNEAGGCYHKDARCLTSITPEMVYEKFKEVF